MSKDKLAYWIARHLPKRIVLWSAIDVAAFSTTGKYGKTIANELTALDAYDRYARDHDLYGYGAPPQEAQE